MTIFNPPTDRRPFAKPLEMFGYARGRTVYRSGGVWHEGSDFDWDTLAAADVVPVADRPGGERVDNRHDHYVFLGGRVYEVSAAVATALTNADPAERPGGYGDFLT